MDIHLPLMDGFAATRQIRALEKERGWGRAPVIAMTANAFKEDIQMCLDADMDDHLAKPMSAELTVLTLQKYLEISSSSEA